MNPIERLEILAADILGDAHHTSLDDCIAEGCNYRGMCSDVRERHAELRAIIEALKQRDEAVRRVRREMEAQIEWMDRSSPTAEYSTGDLRKALGKWSAALEGKHE
jgi:hypothetical protein